MKTFINRTASILVLLVLYSCNADVFVDDFTPSVSELTLDGNGDETIIRFKASNWDVMEISSYSDPSLNYKVYDADNELLAQMQYPYLKGLGKIALDQKYIDFAVERTAPAEVKISVGENVYATPFVFTVTARNDYEWQDIRVTILPSDRYVFDRITYSMNDYFYYEPAEAIKKMKVNNTVGSTPVGWIVYPFRDEYHGVTFTSDDPDAFELLGEEPVTLEIPSIVGEGDMEMNGAKAQYTAELQKLPLPFPDTEKREVTIPPYANQLITLWMVYGWFETSYTLYASHPKTGKQRTFTGTLQSKMPKSHFIIRETIND